MTDIALQSTWPLLFVPIALAVAWWGYRNTTPSIEPRGRWPFIVLRTIAFVLLLLVLAGPVLNRIRQEPLRPQVAVLVDESSSMATVDANGRSRGDAVADVVRTVQAEFATDPVRVEVVPFGGEVAPPLGLESYLHGERQATAAATDIVGSLRQTADRLAGQNLQAILLVSDGRATRGGLDAGVAAALGRPVFVVGVGDTLPPSDLVIDRCEYSPIAYVESEATLEVRIENSGFRGASTLLKLFEDGNELFRTPVAFEADAGRTRVDVPLVFKTPGRKQMQLVLEPLNGESTEQNNVREIRVEVLKGKLRVLCVAARPNWDVAFLARALRDDPNVELELVHRTQAGRWVRSADAASFTLPRTAAELAPYEVIVLGDPGKDSSSFIELVADGVETGRGLLVLAGRESVFTDRAAFEALAKVLPVTRSTVRAPQYRVHTPRLTPQGMLHPVTSTLLPLADTHHDLPKLPPFLGRHAELTAKPVASVLVTSADDEAEPVLVTGRFGGGHVVVWCSFPVWGWGFTNDPVRQNVQLEFTGHLVRWLTQPREVKPVRLTTDKPVHEGGEPVEFVAQVIDQDLQPLTDAELRVEVRRSNVSGAVGTLVLERKSDRPGEYTGRLSGLGPGEYEAIAIAERAGAVAGRDTTQFALESYSTELVNVSQDVDFLREVASHSGGRYSGVEGVTDLVAALPRAPLPVTLRSEVEIWNSSTLFVLFIGALSLEWLLRKRRGLL